MNAMQTFLHYKSAHTTAQHSQPSPPSPRAHWFSREGRVVWEGPPRRPLSTCYALFVIRISCFISMTKLPRIPHTLLWTPLSNFMAPKGKISAPSPSPTQSSSHPPTIWALGRMQESVCFPVEEEIKVKQPGCNCDSMWTCITCLHTVITCPRFRVSSHLTSYSPLETRALCAQCLYQPPGFYPLTAQLSLLVFKKKCLVEISKTVCSFFSSGNMICVHSWLQ